VLIAAGCVAFWFFMNDVFVPRMDPPGTISMETISLSCLSPQQASELVTPYLRSHGSAVYLAPAIHAITIRGRSDEFANAKRELIRRDIPSSCSLPTNAPVGSAEATSSGRREKD
jgi:hypothetical protein